MAPRPQAHWDQGGRGRELGRQKGRGEAAACVCAAAGDGQAQGTPGKWLRQVRTRMREEGSQGSERPRRKKDHTADTTMARREGRGGAGGRGTKCGHRGGRGTGRSCAGMRLKSGEKGLEAASGARSTQTHLQVQQRRGRGEERPPLRGSRVLGGGLVTVQFTIRDVPRVGTQALSASPMSYWRSSGLSGSWAMSF